MPLYGNECTCADSAARETFHHRRCRCSAGGHGLCHSTRWLAAGLIAPHEPQRHCGGWRGVVQDRVAAGALDCRICQGTMLLRARIVKPVCVARWPSTWATLSAPAWAPGPTMEDSAGDWRPALILARNVMVVESGPPPNLHATASLQYCQPISRRGQLRLPLTRHSLPACPLSAR